MPDQAVAKAKQAVAKPVPAAMPCQAAAGVPGPTATTMPGPAAAAMPGQAAAAMPAQALAAASGRPADVSVGSMSMLQLAQFIQAVMRVAPQVAQSVPPASGPLPKAKPTEPHLTLSHPGVDRTWALKGP